MLDIWLMHICDHCPLLLGLEEERRDMRRDRPFRFEGAWMMHGEFTKWLRKEWTVTKNLPNAL